MVGPDEIQREIGPHEIAARAIPARSLLVYVHYHFNNLVIVVLVHVVRLLDVRQPHPVGNKFPRIAPSPLPQRHDLFDVGSGIREPGAIGSDDSQLLEYDQFVLDSYMVLRHETENDDGPKGRGHSKALIKRIRVP